MVEGVRAPARVVVCEGLPGLPVACKAASSKQQAASTCEMGKIRAPLWCFGFAQNFGGCYLWV